MPQAPRKSSGRKPRLASLLEHKLAEYFKTEMDLPGLISISFVEVAPNMQHATVWLSIYGADPDEVLVSLKRETGKIRKYMIKQISTKYIPQLTYRIDVSQEHAQTISEALKELEDEV